MYVRDKRQSDNKKFSHQNFSNLFQLLNSFLTRIIIILLFWTGKDIVKLSRRGVLVSYIIIIFFGYFKDVIWLPPLDKYILSPIASFLMQER